MQDAQEFSFGDYSLNTDLSIATFSYVVRLHSGERIAYKDTLEFARVTKDQWESIPKPLLTAMLQDLSIMLGINYWKIHCAPQMRIEGFGLTREQAEFWNVMYTKGLAEFFFKSNIDFRGLISFPHEETRIRPLTRLSQSDRVLLTQGGGKDSIVSAEILKKNGVPFDVFILGKTEMQTRVAKLIGHRTISVRRKLDCAATRLQDSGDVERGFPSTSTITFIAIVVAALNGHRYVMLSNEQSAETGNIEYLGLEVNHQWSKSIESEMLIREYLERFVTPDIIPFSMLHQFTEIEMVRRFATYPKYFHSFSSCNMNFYLPLSDHGRPEMNRAYWCNACPKCVFMFACLTAFLPKEIVTDIFGANLYSDQGLIPIFKELLGLEGFKPFECVGTPEEMLVAMYRAQETGSYDKEPAMMLFKEHDSLRVDSLKDMQDRVFSIHGPGTIPREFAPFLKEGL